MPCASSLRLIALGLMLGLPVAVLQAQPTATAASDADRTAALQARIAALENELAAIKRELGQFAPIESTPIANAPQASAPTEAVVDDFAQFAAPSESSPATTATAPRAASAAANAFNPAISIVLNGSYSHRSAEPALYQRAGFAQVGEGGPPADGFSLGESEISFAASIDDRFYGQLTAALESDDGEDALAIEEAYIDTTALPDGLTLRTGRFFSNIGYLNSHHAHTDNFFDRPLPYQAFLGNQYGDDGVQLRWVAPTALLLELGGEVFRGNSFPAGGAARSGLGSHSLFAHLGGDAGIEHSWLAGLSTLRTRAEPADDGFSGDARLLLADATWKWAPQGNFRDGGVTVRGEYFREQRDGVDADPDSETFGAFWNGRREGAYLEGVYRFSRRWDAGYRFDRLWSSLPPPFDSDFDPERHTLQLTWRNSEFSLLRLQLSHDTPDAGRSDNTVTVQYQNNLGAHGAHKF